MMCWNIKKVKAAVYLTAVAVVISCKIVQAEEGQTANDFFAIYNEAQIDDYNELKGEFLAAKAAYEETVTDIQRAEFYNAAAQTAKEYFKKEETDIDSEIENLIADGNSIKQEIADGIFGDWDNLVLCDMRYKVKLERVNELLKEKDRYVMVSTRDIDYNAALEMRHEMEELSTSYKAASAVSVLGDVTGVRYPLNKETVVTSRWGNRIDPITGAGVNFHSGLDLRAGIGTEVQALFNGRVESAGFNSVAGNYVRIDHGNGIKTYYCHLSEITCTEGQEVKQYEGIALSGNTGSRTTGPHLHLAVYIDNNSVDPGILFGN